MDKLNDILDKMEDDWYEKYIEEYFKDVYVPHECHFKKYLYLKVMEVCDMAWDEEQDGIDRIKLDELLNMLLYMYKTGYNEGIYAVNDDR